MEEMEIGLYEHVSILRNPSAGSMGSYGFGGLTVKDLYSVRWAD